MAMKEYRKKRGMGRWRQRRHHRKGYPGGIEGGKRLSRVCNVIGGDELGETKNPKKENKERNVEGEREKYKVRAIRQGGGAGDVTFLS